MLAEVLTRRELQVVRLLGRGLTVTGIGRDLGISVKTASTFRMRALKKLGMSTTAELMRAAIVEELTTRTEEAP